MGCHTWFSRPLKDEEFQLMKDWAPNDILRLTKDEEYGLDDKWLYNLLMKSYNENIPCVFGKYWYELGYGCYNPKFIDIHGSEISIHTIECKLFVDMSFNWDICENKYGVALTKFKFASKDEELNFPYFHDVFRIGRYPRKVIHNRRELRRYLGKRYFELTEFQLQRVSKFFEMYPGGVITFG